MDYQEPTQEELFQHAVSLIHHSDHLPPEEAQLNIDYGFNVMNKLSIEGFSDAQHYLGDYFYHGLQQPENAFQFYYASSLNGSIKGKYMTAIFLKEGLAGEKNQEEAFRLMFELAQHNIDYAQLDLGLMYLHGQGCEPSLEHAFTYFKLAAEQGHLVAQFDLPSCYFNGEGTQQDYEKALHWFNQSALQGYGESYYNMGMIFMHGFGRPQHMDNAIDCFVLGARFNDLSSIDFLNEHDIDINQPILNPSLIAHSLKPSPSFEALSHIFSCQPDTFELHDLNQQYNQQTPLFISLMADDLILTQEQWDYLFNYSDLGFVLTTKEFSSPLFTAVIASKNPSLNMTSHYWNLLINQTNFDFLDDSKFSHLIDLITGIGSKLPHLNLTVQHLEEIIKKSNLMVNTTYKSSALSLILSQLERTQIYYHLSDETWHYIFEHSDLNSSYNINQSQNTIVDLIQQINNEEWRNYLLSIYQNTITKHAPPENNVLH